MKIIFCAVLSFLLSNCFSQAGFLGLSVARDSILFSGKTVDFIGNSITLGNVGVSPQSNRWPTVFSTAKGCTENNIAISGQTLQDATGCGLTKFDRTTIPTYSGTHAALFIALGINDIGINNPSLTSAKYKLLLDTVIQYAVTTKGWPSKRIVLITPYWISNYALYDAYGCGHVTANVTIHEAYVDAVFAAALANYCNMADVYTAMKNSPAKGTFLSADGLHPNNTGAAFIATFLAGLKFTL